MSLPARIVTLLGLAVSILSADGPAAPLPLLHDGNHQLVFRNNYRPHVSVYLANALAPVDGRVEVRSQERDVTQSKVTIDYVLRAQSRRLSAWLLLALGAAGVVALWYFAPRGSRLAAR